LVCQSPSLFTVLNSKLVLFFLIFKINTISLLNSSFNDLQNNLKYTIEDGYYLKNKKEEKIQDFYNLPFKNNIQNNINEIINEYEKELFYDLEKYKNQAISNKDFVSNKKRKIN
jgi:hypothetical protein